MLNVTKHFPPYQAQKIHSKLLTYQISINNRLLKFFSVSPFAPSSFQEQALFWGLFYALLISPNINRVEEVCLSTEPRGTCSFSLPSLSIWILKAASRSQHQAAFPPKDTPAPRGCTRRLVIYIANTPTQGEGEKGLRAVHTQGASRCLVWMGMRVILNGDSRAIRGQATRGRRASWGVCIFFGRRWEAWFSPCLGRLPPRASTKSNSVGATGVACMAGGS